MKIKKGFTLRSVMGQNIILAEGTNADTYNKIITLNDSATTLWKALQGKNFTPQDAANILVAKYSIDPAQALSDSEYILSKMQSKGLLEE